MKTLINSERVTRQRRERSIKSAAIKLSTFAVLCLAASACNIDTIDTPDTPDVPKGNYHSRTIELSEAEKEASAQSNQFAWQLFALCADGKSNTAISPVSANICLSMLANATAGNSQAQLLQALGFEAQDMEHVNSLNKKLAADICNLDPAIKLTLANSFWYDKTLNPKPDFVNDMLVNYAIESYVIDHKTYASDVNSWANKKTNGLIPHILDDDHDADFALMNALYFKGMWHYDYKFEKAKTKRDIFTNDDATTALADYMCNKGEYGYYCHDQWRAMSIPFGGNGFMFTAILPDEGCTIAECLPSISAWEPATGRWSYKALDLMLPKFKMQTENNLIPALEAMGVTDIFDPEKANLSNLSNTPLVIGLAQQNVSFEINEEGAEAAAVTIVDGYATSMGPMVGDYEQFHVNRPFIYMISERSTGTILFVGCVNEF